MKITVDIDKLLKEGKITKDEYDRFIKFAEETTYSRAFNILIGFGVVAVSIATLALVPEVMTAIIIGLIVLTTGLLILHENYEQWKIVANICILIGALMIGAGIIIELHGSLLSILLVTAIFAITGIFARSSLLVVLATLMLSASIGARTGYFHAAYFLAIQEPTATITFFSIFAIALYQLSKRISADFRRLAIVSARTSIFLVNFGFWVGSLWGERSANSEIVISDITFSILWALALIATAIWSWRENRIWVLNTVAIFGGIHFYTQWFEHLGTSASTVLIAGLLALGFAIGLRAINREIRESE